MRRRTEDWEMPRMVAASLIFEGRLANLRWSWMGHFEEL